jgi:gp6-like head-tail connector protein
VSLRVLTPAPVTDLLDLVSVKTRLGITDTSEDALLAEYIDEVCSFLRGGEIFGRELARQTYQETFFPRQGACELRLSCNPVDSDSVSVSIDGTVLVAGTDFEVRNAEAGILYRSSGWWCSTTVGSGGVVVTYAGGFLIPASATAKGVVTPWAAAQAYLAGAWVRAVGTPQALRFECTTAGTSHATVEPTWPTTAGGTVTDGTAVWTARQAWELPADVRRLGNTCVRDLRFASYRAPGLLSSAGDGFSETYSAGSGGAGISPDTIKAFGALRAQWGRM